MKTATKNTIARICGITGLTFFAVATILIFAMFFLYGMAYDIVGLTACVFGLLGLVCVAVNYFTTEWKD